VALDALSALGFAPGAAYRLLFTVLFVLLVFALWRTSALVRLGPLPCGNPWAYSSASGPAAIGLLERLDRSVRPDDEIRIIREIGIPAAP
jgi:hypothetical protein